MPPKRSNSSRGRGGRARKGLDQKGILDAIKASSLTSCYLLYQILADRNTEKASYEQFKTDWLRTYFSTLKIVSKSKARAADRN